MRILEYIFIGGRTCDERTRPYLCVSDKGKPERKREREDMFVVLVGLFVCVSVCLFVSLGLFVCIELIQLTMREYRRR
jgi:nitrate reductase NapE component